MASPDQASEVAFAKADLDGPCVYVFPIPHANVLEPLMFAQENRSPGFWHGCGSGSQQASPEGIDCKNSSTVDDRHKTLNDLPCQVLVTTRHPSMRTVVIAPDPGDSVPAPMNRFAVRSISWPAESVCNDWGIANVDDTLHEYIYVQPDDSSEPADGMGLALRGACSFERWIPVVERVTGATDSGDHQHGTRLWQFDGVSIMGAVRSKSKIPPNKQEIWRRAFDSLLEVFINNSVENTTRTLAPQCRHFKFFDHCGDLARHRRDGVALALWGDGATVMPLGVTTVMPMIESSAHVLHRDLRICNLLRHTSFEELAPRALDFGSVPRIVLWPTVNLPGEDGVAALATTIAGCCSETFSVSDPKSRLQKCLAILPRGKCRIPLLESENDFLRILASLIQGEKKTAWDRVFVFTDGATQRATPPGLPFVKTSAKAQQTAPHLQRLRADSRPDEFPAVDSSAAIGFIDSGVDASCVPKFLTTEALMSHWSGARRLRAKMGAFALLQQWRSLAPKHSTDHLLRYLGESESCTPSPITPPQEEQAAKNHSESQLAIDVARLTSHRDQTGRYPIETGDDDRPNEPGARDHASLPRRRLASFTDFVTDAVKDMAFTAAQQLASAPHAPFHPLFIYGAPGTGKTHLLESICRQLLETVPTAHVVLVSGESFAADFLQALHDNTLKHFREHFRGADALLLDGVQVFELNRTVQQELLDTLVELGVRGRKVAVTGDRHPRQLTMLCDEMILRLNSGLVCRLEAPGLEVRRRIVTLIAERLKGAFAPEVLNFIAKQFTGGAHELDAALKHLQTHSCKTQQGVSLAAVRSSLTQFKRDCLGIVTLEDVERAVCHLFGLKSLDVKSDSDANSLAEPRLLAMFLARRHTRSTYKEIGTHFGGWTPSMVRAAECMVPQWLSENVTIRVLGQSWRIQEIINSLERLVHGRRGPHP